MLVGHFDNGTGSIDHGIGEVGPGEEVMVSPGADTTYTLTVVNSEGVSASASVSITVDKFALNITAPEEGKLVNDELRVAVSIESAWDIVSVVADVADQSQPLELSDSLYVGVISLVQMESDTYTLTVSAEDVEGDVVSRSVSFVLDRPPVLSITEPLPFSVVRPDMFVDVACTDDSGECSLTIDVEQTQLASATSRLTSTINLQEYDGQILRVRFSARDQSNPPVYEEREIYVETSARLVAVGDYPGRIRSLDGERVLVETEDDTGDKLSIYNISSGLVDSVAVPVSKDVTEASLTPIGVMYAVDDGSGFKKIYAWRYGDTLSELSELGCPYGTGPMIKVSGDYAIYRVALEGGELGLETEIWFRQFSSRTSAFVAERAGADVANNGVVVYSSAQSSTGNGVVKYDFGVYTTLAENTTSTMKHTSPLTDGQSFVYGKVEIDVNFKMGALAYHDGTSEILLTDYRQGGPGGYGISSGWVAYTELGGLGQAHVWTRDPTGSLTQRTIFGTSSTLDSLASNGELMFTNSGRRFLSYPDSSYSEVGSTLGTSIQLSGDWYIVIGRSLFLVS
jgi:hypothetical protein